jgi:hypothetical protein
VANTRAGIGLIWGQSRAELKLSKAFLVKKSNFNGVSPPIKRKLAIKQKKKSKVIYPSRFCNTQDS